MNKKSGTYGHVTVNDYHNYTPPKMYEFTNEHSTHPQLNNEQFAKNSEHLNQKELTRLDKEALYWKLLAPLNYKTLEGKYILVCPVCDTDLGFSIYTMIYETHFRLEELWGKKQLQSHDKECKAIEEA